MFASHYITIRTKWDRQAKLIPTTAFLQQFTRLSKSWRAAIRRPSPTIVSTTAGRFIFTDRGVWSWDTDGTWEKHTEMCLRDHENLSVRSRMLRSQRITDGIAERGSAGGCWNRWTDTRPYRLSGWCNNSWCFPSSNVSEQQKFVLQQKSLQWTEITHGGSKQKSPETETLVFLLVFTNIYYTG